MLTFLTVIFSSWRVSNLNIVAAIRGTTKQPAARQHAQANWRWLLLSLPASPCRWSPQPSSAGAATATMSSGVLRRARPPWSGAGYSVAAVHAHPATRAVAAVCATASACPRPGSSHDGGLLLGAAFFITGPGIDTAFPFALGFSLMAAGVAQVPDTVQAPRAPGLHDRRRLAAHHLGSDCRRAPRHRSSASSTATSRCSS